MKTKVEFSSNGHTLRGMLESPDSGAKAYALFAHCFTCGKDIAAASRIARALTQHGIAVLRFDFTGLGNSDGDFSNTNFSSNIQDLSAAVEFLRQEYQAPDMLIGHSLGGAAILALAGQVPEAKAVISIAAPYSAAHVSHNFKASLDAIKQDGQAQVKLGRRQFLIKKQFLDDIEQYSGSHLDMKGKAVLIMHSPYDDTVGIEDAEAIYKAVKHPKSFISLDNADHLLTKKADAEYVASSIVGWVGRYLSLAAEEKPPSASKGKVIVEEKNQSFTQHVTSDSHYWLADEPVEVGGNNLGPDPYEHLLAALGTCTSMTLRMYANRKSLPLEKVKVELEHSREYDQDCQSCSDEERKIEVLTRKIELTGDLNQAQKDRLIEIADKCPVHKTLHSNLQVKSELVD